MSKLIGVTQLTYRYDNRKPDGVLDLNFELYKGEILALLGPSGAGKTTTLKLLQGQLEPQKGKIQVYEPIKYGFVRQHFEGDKDSTVFDYIAQALSEIENEDKIENMVRSTLLQLDLTNERDSKLSAISGGQLQRVMIARELAQGPNLIFFDEPFANLDYNLKAELLEEILPLFKENDITIIWTTHHTEEVLPHADRILLMNSGEIQALGTPKELFFKPQNIFTALYFGKNNILPAKAKNSLTITVLNKDYNISNKGAELVCIRPNAIKWQQGTETEIHKREFYGAYTLLEVLFEGHAIWVQVPPSLGSVNTIKIELPLAAIHILS